MGVIALWYGFCLGPDIKHLRFGKSDTDWFVPARVCLGDKDKPLWLSQNTGIGHAICWEDNLFAYLFVPTNAGSYPNLIENCEYVGAQQFR